MNLSPAQFPTNSWNPFAAMAGRVGKSKTHGLVSNQEHEGQNLQRAIVVGAIQHHFTTKAAEQQNSFEVSRSNREHQQKLESLHAGAKLVQGGTAFHIQTGDIDVSGMKAARAPKKPAVPVKPDTSGGWMEHGPNGKPRRKQP